MRQVATANAGRSVAVRLRVPWPRLLSTSRRSTLRSASELVILVGNPFRTERYLTFFLISLFAARTGRAWVAGILLTLAGVGSLIARVASIAAIFSRDDRDGLCSSCGCSVLVPAVRVYFRVGSAQVG